MDGINRPFLFAQDRSGKQYFIPRTTLEFEANIWDSLDTGDCLEILLEPYPQEDGKYPRAIASRFRE
jgi:hypothetical protein